MIKSKLLVVSLDEQALFLYLLKGLSSLQGLCSENLWLDMEMYWLYLIK